MIVMNGFRILQSHNGQGWETVGTIKKVEKGIVAGVYNIFLYVSSFTPRRDFFASLE